MARLDGKVALITGGTTAISEATARLFQAEGATMTATGANAAGLDKARAALPGVEVVLSDQSDPAASQALVDDVVRRHGRVDMLFVNAGVASFAPLEQLTEADFDRQLGINVKGALFAAKAAAPHIPQGGAIVFTASTATSSGMAKASVYAATNAAVRSVARTLGAEPHRAGWAARRDRQGRVLPGRRRNLRHRRGDHRRGRPGGDLTAAPVVSRAGPLC